MTRKTETAATTERAAQPTNLTRQYGDIGISAVAAAMRFTGTAETANEFPAAPALDQRFVESSH